MDSLTASVLRVLKSPTLNKTRPTKIGSSVISAENFRNLADKIKRNGLPYIKWYPQLPYSGYYEPVSDTLWFQFSCSRGLLDDAVIIHEATHAALDMANGPAIMIGDSETLAYITQCQYYIVNNPNPENRLMDSNGEGTAKDLVFELAMGVASTLLQNETPSEDDIFQLRQAVSNDPEYYKNFFTMAAYNGI
jgi:hypothetical protein